jgi:hypothetical protein
MAGRAGGQAEGENEEEHAQHRRLRRGSRRLAVGAATTAHGAAGLGMAGRHGRRRKTEGKNQEKYAQHRHSFRNISIRHHGTPF